MTSAVGRIRYRVTTTADARSVIPMDEVQFQRIRRFRAFTDEACCLL